MLVGVVARDNGSNGIREEALDGPAQSATDTVIAQAKVSPERAGQPLQAAPPTGFMIGTNQWIGDAFVQDSDFGDVGGVASRLEADGDSLART